MRGRRLILSSTPLVLAGLVLAGCAAQTATGSAAPAPAESVETAVVVDGDLAADAVLAANEDATVTRDDEWSAADAVDVDLSSASGSVTIDDAGVYRLTGSLTGGVVVAAPDDAQVVLILDGVDIQNSSGPAITVASADDVVVNLAADSVNAVSDASSYADDASANAAIYADADLTISGTGSLTVTGNGNDGITSTDDLAVLAGSIAVDAIDDAIRGKDALIVEGGDLTLTAGGDALKSDQDQDAARGYIWVSGGAIAAESGDDGLDAFTDVVVTGGSVEVTAGTGVVGEDASAKGISAGAVAVLDGGDVTVTADDDAVHSDGSVGIGGASVELAAGDDAVHAEQVLQIRDGDVVVTSAAEGLEGVDVEISGGTVDVTASDDGINAAGNAGTGNREEDSGETLVISGGSVRVAGGGDGLDSNGSITITGGDVTVAGPTGGGDGAIDANGSITIDGGTVAVGGSVLRAPTGAQGWVAASVSGSAGDTIEITDAAGTVVGSFEALAAYGAVFLAGDVIESGATYTVSVDGAAAATATAGTALANGGPGGGKGGGPGGAQGGGPSAPDRAAEGRDPARFAPRGPSVVGRAAGSADHEAVAGAGAGAGASRCFSLIEKNCTRAKTHVQTDAASQTCAIVRPAVCWISGDTTAYPVWIANSHTTNIVARIQISHASGPPFLANERCRAGAM